MAPLLVLVIGTLAGFADSTIGSGGLISIPFLIFLGLPPAVAVATDRLGTLGQIGGALAKFWKTGKILWSYVPIFSVLSLAGALLGAQILLTIDSRSLEKVIGAILLIVLPLIFLKPNLGLEHRAVSRFKKGLGLIIYFLVKFYDGLFGTGAGPLSLYNSLFFFGFTMLEANATNLIPWLLLSLSSLAIFMLHGIVDYRNGVFLLVGMALGGYLGAHTALKIGNLWLRRLFVAVVIISGVKLLFL